MLSVIGIDPGMVNSGLVYLSLDPESKTFTTAAYAFDGAPVKEIAQRVQLYDKTPVFIEEYRPRSALNTDKWMIETIALLKHEIPGAKDVPNWGIKKIVTKDLLEVLGLWTFDIRTHHQDIRSAARIGILAGLKDTEFNETLAQLITDYVDGKPWEGKKLWHANE